MLKIEPILFIAPSQAIADTAGQVAAEMGLSLHIRIGAKEEAKNVALTYPNIGIYISGGGVAQVLKGIRGKTVIELTTNGMAVEAFEFGPVSIRQAINEAVKVARAQELEHLREQETLQQIQNNVTMIYTSLERIVAVIDELTASSEEFIHMQAFEKPLITTTARKIKIL